METTTPASFTQQIFETFLQSRREPAWLTAAREAWEIFTQLPWPSRSDEEWSRTDIRMLRVEKYLPQIDGSEQLGSDLGTENLGLLRQGVDLGGQVTSVNGQVDHVQLVDKWRARGVLFGNLADLVCEHDELLRPHLLAQLVPPDYDKFAALQAAFWTGGYVLYVPRGVVVDEPLHTLNLLSDGAAEVTRSLVVLEDGAEATLLCETESFDLNDSGFHCGNLEVMVERGAHLRVVNLQNWGHNTWNFGHQKSRLQSDASLQWTIAAMGSRLSKVNQHVDLAGPGADCQVNGVMFTEGKQHIAYNTLQHHTAPSCHSDFLYKGALQDKSRTVWRGMIKVDLAAQKTDGYQRNDNLLLSSNVRADSIPGLEIEADDVRCTHGSTSGRVDEEMIFYGNVVASPGKRQFAIVSGFFQQIFDRISIESVRDALGEAIGRRVRDYE